MSARVLHEFLEIKTAYKDWFPRMAEYGFEEKTDFTVMDIFASNSNAGKQTK